MLYLGADHRGFELKEKIKKYLESEHIAFKDMGAFKYDKDDDYPDFAYAVAKNVAKNFKENRGIVLCGSGVGVNAVANKVKGTIAGLFFNSEQAKEATAHDYVNIAVFPTDYISEGEATVIVKAFLETPYSENERYMRRVKKVKEIEKYEFNQKTNFQ